MLVNNNGNELNVTDKFTLGQLLKHGAVLVEDVKATEEVDTSKGNKEDVKEPIQKPTRTRGK